VHGTNTLSFHNPINSTLFDDHHQSDKEDFKSFPSYEEESSVITTFMADCLHEDSDNLVFLDSAFLCDTMHTHSMADPAWGIWGKCPPPHPHLWKGYSYQR